MNILYLAQSDLDLNNEGIFTGLINALLSEKCNMTLLCSDHAYHNNDIQYHKDYKKILIKAHNQFGVNIIKKGIVLLTLERKMKKAIRKYLKNDSFDLVLYATPPITFSSVIKYCKKKFNCKSYLMLKDIFPQNAVDIGMMGKKGITGLLYSYFRKKEKALYISSDKIGCMSQANIDYILKHNQIDKEKMELFPNSLKIKPFVPNENREILKSLGIYNKQVFIYGGNLGKPQGLNFLINGIKVCKDIEEVHFIIIGKGTEQKRVFNELKNSKNVTTLEFLPKEEYLKLCKECDIGLVLLDKRFTIPNYPSRILSYMENAKPVLACTDKASDIKELVEEQAECGRWIFSENPNDFKNEVLWFVNNKEKLYQMGMNGRKYFEQNFDVTKHLYKIERIIQNN